MIRIIKATSLGIAIGTAMIAGDVFFMMVWFILGYGVYLLYGLIGVWGILAVIFIPLLLGAAYHDGSRWLEDGK